MTLTRWRQTDGLGTTFRQPSYFEDELGELFQAFGSAFDFGGRLSPAVDLYEKNDLVTVKAEVPGLKKEEIEITLQDGMLVLKGEPKEAQEKAGQSSGRLTRRFQRTISLPYKVNAAAIKAAYEDGILTVELPKAEEAKRKQIKIEFN